MRHRIRSVHPFPARMAPDLVFNELQNNSKKLRVLDPMAGSGTTLVAARMQGHVAVGFDRDPLAVLIARSWLAPLRSVETASIASNVVARARVRAKNISLSQAFPRNANLETKDFVRYWFDNTNRIQLAALSETISRLHDPSLRNLMWCAFSRLIITKNMGTSLAMDVSHSRPHKVFSKAPINAFDSFESAVKRITNAAPFSDNLQTLPEASVSLGDARQLPLADRCVDLVITSPPYLNAIDYIRGHKFSLIWMGHSIEALRDIRSTNVGAESKSQAVEADLKTEHILRNICSFDALTSRQAGILRHYVKDMRLVLSETRRVLRHGGKAVFVVGNCNISNIFIRNSRCVTELARENGLRLTKTVRRPLPDNRRYLPPPKSGTAGTALQKRMREEVILTLLKD